MGISHYENFPVASWLLPAPLREPVQALYNFARQADDIADEGEQSEDERLSALDELSLKLSAIESGETFTDPLWSALCKAVRQHGLPLRYLRDLLSAFRQDVHKKRYATYEELLNYCQRSANSVGHAMLRLMKIEGEKQERQAGNICTALQLINHWQDVALDWDKGRVYLPQEDLERFGVHEDTTIGQKICDSAWRQLMAFQIARARAMMAQGAPLAYYLRGRLGWELRATVAGGMTIANKIESVNYDVFRHRPVLSKKDKWRLIAAIFPRPSSRFVS